MAGCLATYELKFVNLVAGCLATYELSSDMPSHVLCLCTIQFPLALFKEWGATGSSKNVDIVLTAHVEIVATTGNTPKTPMFQYL